MESPLAHGFSTIRNFIMAMVFRVSRDEDHVRDRLCGCRAAQVGFQKILERLKVPKKEFYVSVGQFPPISSPTG